MRNVMRRIMLGFLGTLVFSWMIYLGFSYWAHHKLHGVVTFDWGRAVDATPVHFEIGGHHLAIPKNYLYSRGDWRGGKVEGILLEAILPDMQGYTMDNRAEFERLGWGKKITFHIELPPDNYSIAIGYQRMKTGFDPVENSSDADAVPGLEHLADRYATGYDFFAHKADDTVVRWTKCKKKGSASSPSCHGPLKYSDRLYINYSFSRDYLPQWQEVHESVRHLIQSFEENTARK